MKTAVFSKLSLTALIAMATLSVSLSASAEQELEVAKPDQASVHLLKALGQPNKIENIKSTNGHVIASYFVYEKAIQGHDAYALLQHGSVQNVYSDGKSLVYHH